MLNSRWTLLFVAFLVVMVGTIRADDIDSNIHKELQKALENRDKEFEAQIAKLIESQVKAALAKQQEQITRLEAELKKLQDELKVKDEKIAKLTGKPVEKTKLTGKPVEKTKLTEAFIGVDHIAPPDDQLDKLKLKKGQGAQIVSLYPEGPGEKSGLEEGDIILSVDGKDVGSETLEQLVRSFEPGKKVKLDLLRGQEKLSRDLNLGNRSEYLAKVKPIKAPVPKEVINFGIVVAEVEGNPLELEIKEVEEDLSGAAADLKVGDLIVAVNDTPIKTFMDLGAVRENILVGDKFKVEVKRNGKTVVSEAFAGYLKGEAKTLEQARREAEANRPKELGLKITEWDDGTLEVAQVKPDSAAAAFGLKDKDIILQVDNKDVKTIDDIRGALSYKIVGDKIDFVLKRGSDKVTIEGVTIAAKGEKVVAAKDAPKDVASAEKPDAAVVAVANEKGYLGLEVKEGEDGLLFIIEIVKTGPAAQAELKKEDVILKINGKPVSTIDDMILSLKGAFAGTTIDLAIKRGEAEMAVKVTLGKFPG